MRVLALVLLAGVALASASAQTDERIKQAGVCSRCHVISVVEWSMSGHPKAGTDCVACHLPSKGHVADERNNVKPERLPRGEQIATLCASCHTSGCPKTQAAAGCQTCHHVHALVDPRKTPSTRDERLEKLTAASAQAAQNLAAGDRFAAQGKWAEARSEYSAALALSPHDFTARRHMQVAANYLRRDWPGFVIGSDSLRDSSGLPKQAKVQNYPIEMVLVPGGDAEIGSPRFASSKPVHTVAIEPFYLARTEVTQALWRTVMGSNPSAHQGGEYPDADRLPVEQVSWNDAQAFLDKLNRAVPGGGFRLPTEAEWEFAARRAATISGERPAPRSASRSRLFSESIGSLRYAGQRRRMVFQPRRSVPVRCRGRSGEPRRQGSACAAGRRLQRHTGPARPVPPPLRKAGPPSQIQWLSCCTQRPDALSRLERTSICC